MDVSIIVSVYNSKETIRECLLSIFNSDFDRNFEVIVVDDGSTDNSIEKIKDLDVRIIRQKNRGAAGARNAGVKLAISDLFIFVDSDVVLFKETLKKVYGHLKKDDVDYVTVRYSKSPLNDRWIHRYKALADYMYYYDFIFSKGQRQKPIRQVAISGGLEGYKRKVFEELGGFDEKIKGASIEQEKLISKLSQNYNMLADGNITTGHYFPNFKKLIRDYFSRTFSLMDIAGKGSYDQPYFKKNSFRVASGFLTLISLPLSAVLFLRFRNTPFFIIGLFVFLCYLVSHFKMFIVAVKEYGFLFMLYTVIINLFFCFLISLAGFLGLIRAMIKR